MWITISLNINLMRDCDLSYILDMHENVLTLSMPDMQETF